MVCPKCNGLPFFLHLTGRPCPECGGLGVVHCCEGENLDLQQKEEVLDLHENLNRDIGGEGGGHA